MSLEIKPGTYRTRGGQKATVFAVGMRGDYSAKGIIHYSDDDMISEWGSDGRFYNDQEDVSEDIISEWIETPEVDWSAIPFRFVAMDEDGRWCGYFMPPTISLDFDWWDAHNKDFYAADVLNEHSPKWTGDWKQSLVERPEGK